MQQVTLRDFLRNIKSFLPPPDAGLQVVRRDGADFFIYPSKQETSDITSDIPMGTSPEIIDIESRWCDLHFERGKAYECRNISWEDETGELRVDHKWACPKCYNKYKSMSVGMFYDS